MVWAFPPGSRLEKDILSFTILFVSPETYPESQVWLMSDNEAICDMLSVVAEEFMYGADLELVLSRVLSLFGHEDESLRHLFVSHGFVTEGKNVFVKSPPSGFIECRFQWEFCISRGGDGL